MAHLTDATSATSTRCLPVTVGAACTLGTMAKGVCTSASTSTSLLWRASPVFAVSSRKPPTSWSPSAVRSLASTAMARRVANSSDGCTPLADARAAFSSFKAAFDRADTR